jgi:chorismate mutase
MVNFDLAQIADRLESMEETIISRILDRMQYKKNSPVYSTDKVFTADALLSPLDYMHKQTEQIFAQLGKFTVAEEKPFFSETSLPINSNIVQIKELFGKDILSEINITGKIKEHYLSFINISCENGDDSEYGSTAEADISALLAVSKRIHYGSFYVAESKYLSNPSAYTEAVKANDKNAITQMLTRREVEEKIILRVQDKCEKIQNAYTSKLRKKIAPRLIGNFYEFTIIPLTKDGELKYLFRRCESENR